MIEPAFEALLVTAVGSAALLAPGFRAASRTALALPSIAMRANPEHRLALPAAANALPENHFAMSLHPPTQADFDNGNGSCQRRTSFDGGLLMKVAKPEPRRSNGGVLYRLPSHNTSFCWNVFNLTIDRRSRLRRG